MQMVDYTYVHRFCMGFQEWVKSNASADQLFRPIDLISEAMFVFGWTLTMIWVQVADSNGICCRQLVVIQLTLPWLGPNWEMKRKTQQLFDFSWLVEQLSLNQTSKILTSAPHCLQELPPMLRSPTTSWVPANANGQWLSRQRWGKKRGGKSEA